MALRTDQQSNVVHAMVLRDVQLLLNLALVLQRVKNSRVQVAHIILISIRHEFFVEVVALLVFDCDARILLLLDFGFCSVAPLICVSSLARWLAREVDKFFVSCNTCEWIERGVHVLHELSSLLKLLKVEEIFGVTLKSRESFLISILLFIFDFFIASVVFHLDSWHARCFSIR